MRRLKNQLVGATIAILVAAAPVLAQQTPPQDIMPERTEKALKDAMETLLNSLQNMFKAIPQYEMPEVLENGDIIIRRKIPKDKEAPGKTLPDDTDAT